MSVLLRNVLYSQPSVGYRGYILFSAEIFRVTINPSRPIVSWNKRGFVCPFLLPPSDLTIFVDVERNPGPCCPTLNSTAHFTTSSYNVRGLNLRHQKHYQPSCISYERNRLLSLRHWSKHYCSPAFLGKLKAMDVLRYRGKRAGRLHKQTSTENGLRIPVICSGRRHYHASLNIQNATSTLQICESRPLGVNVNNSICIRPDPLQSKLPTVVPLDFCLLNSRSICNKSRLINDFIADHSIDLCALSETWLRGDDSDLYYIRDIRPDGYVFHHVPRLHTTGGGVGIVLKNNIKAKIQVQESYWAKFLDGRPLGGECTNTICVLLSAIQYLQQYFKYKQVATLLVNYILQKICECKLFFKVRIKWL